VLQLVWELLQALVPLLGVLVLEEQGEQVLEEQGEQVLVVPQQLEEV
jgi:hypothetical protein